jgi:hypothetical protein
MSDQDDRIRHKVAEVTEMLRSRPSNSRLTFPSSTSIIKAITSQPQPLGKGELPEEVTASEYDDWVLQALFDLTRTPQRFQAHPDNPTLIECPRARLLRIGREAKLEGKPSDMFRYLMEVTDNGATLPHVTGRAMLAAQKYLDIAVAFKRFVADFDRKEANFKDLKCKFRREREDAKIYVSESTLERALKAHDLNWSAYAIDAPRKGTRKKRT